MTLLVDVHGAAVQLGRRTGGRVPAAVAAFFGERAVRGRGQTPAGRSPTGGRA